MRFEELLQRVDRIQMFRCDNVANLFADGSVRIRIEVGIEAGRVDSRQHSEQSLAAVQLVLRGTGLRLCEGDGGDGDEQEGTNQELPALIVAGDWWLVCRPNRVPTK